MPRPGRDIIETPEEARAMAWFGDRSPRFTERELDRRTGTWAERMQQEMVDALNQNARDLAYGMISKEEHDAERDRLTAQLKEHAEGVQKLFPPKPAKAVR